MRIKSSSYTNGFESPITGPITNIVRNISDQLQLGHIQDRAEGTQKLLRRMTSSEALLGPIQSLH